MNQLCNSNFDSCLLLLEKISKGILKKVKRALTQSRRVVCELRNARKDHGELQRAVIRLFEGDPNIRRIVMMMKSLKVGWGRR